MFHPADSMTGDGVVRLNPEFEGAVAHMHRRPVSRRTPSRFLFTNSRLRSRTRCIRVALRIVCWMRSAVMAEER